MTPTSLLKAIRSLDDLPHPKAAARIRRLDPYRQLDAEQTKLAIGKMFRGATMLKHALEWKNPSVGKGAKLDADRGMIWRHVMAYSGFEQLENGLFGNQPHNSEGRKKTLSEMDLKHRLPGPVLSQRAMDHLHERQEHVDSLCEFLSIRMNQRGRFTKWLMGQLNEDECGNGRSLMICAQLRHLVAHGALSADRARKLGLTPCYAAAPELLHEVTANYFGAIMG